MDPDTFAARLYDKMARINPGVEEMEPYEFRYALDNLVPADGGWGGVAVDPVDQVEALVDSSAFYAGIQIKPRRDGAIVLDGSIVRLTRMLFAGLAGGDYTEEWVRHHFYFDIRGFYFLHRTAYFTEAVVAHLGGRPVRTFAPAQARLERAQDIGYRAFRLANAEVDQAFMDAVERLIARRPTPMLLAIAGPTAAGKTEIVDRLRRALEGAGRSTTAVEMDNLLTDRDQREERGIGSLGREAIHYELFRQGLHGISRGQRITIPRYDFLDGTSSHDLAGALKPGRTPLVVEPADIVFVEGNFPFLLPEIAPLIGVKVVYLTDDAVRLKRKWKRDIDYRKKYDPSYLRNRFFREQFLMAERCYRPQLELCDLAVDTTAAALWAAPAIAAELGG